MSTPASPISNPAPKEYVTKDRSLIRELLNDQVAPGLGMSLAEAIVEAAHGTVRHSHTDSDEIYYCLEGRGRLYVDGTAVSFSKGDFYLIRKNSKHRLEAETRLRLLCICNPGYSHEQTILEPTGPDSADT